MPSNLTFTGTGYGEIDFGREIVNILHISVQNDPIEISLDGKQHYMTLKVGAHTLEISVVSRLYIRGNGDWQVMGSFHNHW